MVIHLVAVCVAFNLFVRLYEEPKLTATYPAEYQRYQSHVPRWWPRRTPWKEQGNQDWNLSGPASVQGK
jgi:protein-S-isoprenylcysteine O-methyltransferase Ste14